MRVERCSLFSFPSPCPEKWLKLTSYFIYALFHPTSLLLVRIYEARKQEPNCSSASYSPFLVLVCFLFEFYFFFSCAERALPCLTAYPEMLGMLSSPHPAPYLVKIRASALGVLGLQPETGCAKQQPWREFDVQKTPGSDLYSLLFPFLWFHSISLVLPRSGELSALLRPTELHPLFRSHLLTSSFFFFSPPREAIRQRRYVVMWMVYTNISHCIFSLFFTVDFNLGLQICASISHR